jgi:2-polyprenyl-3-methyl-5-hydroxy-6-metoxy-1,4-benzoquinol methylase
MCGSKEYHILGKRLNQSQGSNPRNKIGVTTTIVRCKQCGLNYANPQPIPASIADHYGIPPESYWSKQYFEIKEADYKRELDLFKSLRRTDGFKVLDIGAGVGKAMVAMQRAGLDPYGLEPSEPFYKKAIERMGISAARLQLESVEAAAYPAETFDWINFGAVFEHVYNPDEVLARALHWLRPNGLIYIEVPNSNWLMATFARYYYRLRGTDYVINLSPMHTPFHLHEFTHKCFEAHDKVHGYDVALHKYHPCETYMPKFVAPFFQMLMALTSTGMQLEVWLRKKAQTLNG